MIKRKISFSLFFLSVTLCILNLKYNLIGDQDLILFWISTFILFSTIVFQIFEGVSSKIILPEIFTVYMLLHLVYQVGYFGLRGSDSYADYNFFKSILNYGHFSLAGWIEGWPMIHIFSTSVTLITKIEALTVAKFIPSVISSLIVFPFYSLVHAVYMNNKVSLLSSLLFSTIPQFVTFEALFIREVFGLFVMILFLYLIYISKKKKDNLLVFLSIFLMPIMVLSHHFTSFQLLILMSIYIFIFFTSNYLGKNNFYNITNLTDSFNIKNSYLLFFVILLFYWSYYAIFVFGKFLDTFYEICGVNEFVAYAQGTSLGSPIITLRGEILYYGFYLFLFLFVGLLIIKLIVQRKSLKIEDLLFFTFFIFSNFYGFLALYYLGSLTSPQRCLSAGWMIGIMSIVDILSIFKNVYQKNCFVLLLFIFMLFNIYSIDPYYLKNDPSIKGTVSEYKDYRVAESIIFPDEYYLENSQVKYYGDLAICDAIYDVKGLDQRFVIKSVYSIKNLSNSSDICIIKEKNLLYDIELIKQKSYDSYLNIKKTLLYKNMENVHKICEIDDSYYVLKGGC